MVFDYRISRVDFIVGGYAECLQLVMPDNQRIGIMFSRANNGPTEIGIRPFDTQGFGFTVFDVLTPLVLLYKDFGDLVKSEFWGVVQTTNGIVQIVEIIKVS
jgi:hypothetical protein